MHENAVLCHPSRLRPLTAPQKLLVNAAPCCQFISCRHGRLDEARVVSTSARSSTLRCAVSLVQPNKPREWPTFGRQPNAVDLKNSSGPAPETVPVHLFVPNPGPPAPSAAPDYEQGQRAKPGILPSMPVGPCRHFGGCRESLGNTPSLPSSFFAQPCCQHKKRGLPHGTYVFSTQRAFQSCSAFCVTFKSCKKVTLTKGKYYSNMCMGDFSCKGKLIV